MHTRLVRGVLPLAVLLLLMPAVGAVTSYDITVDGDTADLNVTFELYADEPKNFWRVSNQGFPLPERFRVLSVSDSLGPIEDYTFDDGVLRFDTNQGTARTREVVTVHATTESAVTEEYRELDLVRLRLSGFSDRYPDRPDEVTQVQVSTERALHSQSHSLGFDAAMEPNGINLSGEGPVNLHLTVSDQGERYDNMVLFGPGDISTADDLYWVPAAVTGFLPTVNRYPVIVYDAETYEAEVDRWSAGQYRTGGIIFMKRPTLESDHGPGVLLHEVMHGFNEQALRWTRAQRAWFDEGTAKYVEWLVNANRSVPQAEIFGETVRINRTHTYPPRKTPEDLWDYYASGSNAMLEWTLFEQDSIDRTFGYAYGELVIRNHVMEEGAESLQPVYRDLRQLNEDRTEAIEDTATSNEQILSLMDATFRPCDLPSEAQLRACLDEVNEMEPVIPELGDLEGQVDQVPIEPVERPDLDPGGSPILPTNGTVGGDARNLVNTVFAALQRFLQDLLAAFR